MINFYLDEKIIFKPTRHQEELSREHQRRQYNECKRLMKIINEERNKKIIK